MALASRMPGVVHAGALLTLWLFSQPVVSRDIAVVGVPHLQGLETPASVVQLDHVVSLLSRFKPTAVCIEAEGGEQINMAVRDLPRYGAVLAQFAKWQMATAPLQQARIGVDYAEAREQADILLAQPAPLGEEQVLRLVGLQLAAWDAWSALLNWTSLSQQARDSGRAQIGEHAATVLDRLVASGNEIVVVAIPLARASGLRELCAVDAMTEEAWVGELALSAGMAKAMKDPGVQAGVTQLQAEQARRWQPDAGPAALSEHLAWLNGAGFARLDHDSQWQVFADARWREDGERRLMFWHARNAAIASRLLREMGKARGKRVMLIIGAAHRPFLEHEMRARPWVRVSPASTLFPPEPTP